MRSPNGSAPLARRADRKHNMTLSATLIGPRSAPREDAWTSKHLVTYRPPQFVGRGCDPVRHELTLGRELLLDL